MDAGGGPEITALVLAHMRDQGPAERTFGKEAKWLETNGTVHFSEKLVYFDSSFSKLPPR